MKRWQIEQILYLNDMKKNKLALPQSSQCNGPPLHIRPLHKENLFKSSIRKGLGFLVNTF